MAFELKLKRNCENKSAKKLKKNNKISSRDCPIVFLRETLKNKQNLKLLELHFNF